MVEKGAGRSKDVMQTTERLIIEANMPGVKTRMDTVSTGIFSQRRNFLIVTNDNHKDYRLFINARDYGTVLDASWYVVLEPRGIKRAISKAMTGNPLEFSRQVDMFTQQDIRAFTTVATEMFKKALDDLLEELKLDPSVLNTKSRGYLNIW
jgi:hypothetical protein